MKVAETSCWTSCQVITIECYFFLIHVLLFICFIVLMRDLTKVIAILKAGNRTRVAFVPASTLAKNYSNSLYYCYSELHHD
jgi:hypothetical protein